MNAWKQRLMDWDKRDRDLAALEAHLESVGLAAADRALLLAICRDGEPDPTAPARSILRATTRETAGRAGISVGTVSKAKGRLVARGVLRYSPGVFVASWSRVWGLAPVHFWPEDDLDPAGQASAFPRVSARFRAPNPRKALNSNPIPSAKDQAPDPCARPGREQRIGDVLDQLDAAGPNHFEGQVAALARRIVARIRRTEDRLQTPEGERLAIVAAERIARGVCADPDSDTVDELTRVFGSIERKPAEGFTRSPASFLVACAQKRSWIE